MQKEQEPEQPGIKREAMYIELMVFAGVVVGFIGGYFTRAWF